MLIFVYSEHFKKSLNNGDGVKMEVNKAIPPLQFFYTDTLKRMSGKFIVNQHFKVDTDPTASVQISFLGDNFIQHLLHTTETEYEIPEARFDGYNFQWLYSKWQGSFIQEYGGEVNVKFTLRQIWELLKEQGHGESGPLLNNGNINYFCYYDSNNQWFWAVGVRWDESESGWQVLAESMDYMQIKRTLLKEKFQINRIFFIQSTSR